MQTLNFRLTGLTCGACAKLAKRRLEKIDGATEVNVLNDGNSTIVTSLPISKKQIKEALSGSDYDVV